MPSTYDRISEKLLDGIPRPKVFTKFINGKLLTGTKSMHRHKQAMTWRLFWRLKQVRK